MSEFQEYHFDYEWVNEPSFTDTKIKDTKIFRGIYEHSWNYFYSLSTVQWILLSIYLDQISISTLLEPSSILKKLKNLD